MSPGGAQHSKVMETVLEFHALVLRAGDRKAAVTRVAFAKDRTRRANSPCVQQRDSSGNHHSSS